MLRTTEEHISLCSMLRVSFKYELCDIHTHTLTQYKSISKVKIISVKKTAS